MGARIGGTAIDAIWGTPRRAVATTVLLCLLILAGAIAVPGIRDAFAWLMAASPLALLVKAFPNEFKQGLARVAAKFGAISQRAEREAVRQDLEGTLSLGAARLATMAPAASILPLKIDYLRSGEEVERLPDGTLIVGVARHQSRDRNLVATAWAYVTNAVLGDVRSYLDDDVSKGIDFVLTKEILSSVGQGAIREFLKGLWTPSVVGQTRLRGLCAKLDRLQEDQLLGPVLLSEFAELSSSLGFRLPTEGIQKETADFVDYLHDLAIREPGEDIGERSNFDGAQIRCKVIFVARPSVYLVKGPTPYRKAIDWAVRRAYHHVYVLGLGRNDDYVEDVVAPYRTDSRFRSVESFTALRRSQNGRLMRQVVVRLKVDVTYQVGIGHRPIAAVAGGRVTRRSSAS